MTARVINPRGEREFVLTPADFRTIAGLVRADAGIVLSEQKSALVHSRLAKRLRLLQLTSFADYCELVQSPGGTDERAMLLSALTTNVTRFYREPHHFEHLAANVLPSVLARAKQGGRVRFWSAGCSTGEEPYSMALTVLRLCPQAPSLDIKILATDVNPTVVEFARCGIYPRRATAEIPGDLRREWMTEPPDAPDSLAMAPAVRSLVEFRLLNLIKPWPMRASYQAIFCRNVLIYFDEPTQAQVGAQMAALLAARGVLYLGHSERLIGPAADRLRSDGVTTYRVRDSEAEASSR